MLVAGRKRSVCFLRFTSLDLMNSTLFSAVCSLRAFVSILGPEGYKVDRPDGRLILHNAPRATAFSSYVELM